MKTMNDRVDLYMTESEREFLFKIVDLAGVQACQTIIDVLNEQPISAQCQIVGYLQASIRLRNGNVASCLFKTWADMMGVR